MLQPHSVERGSVNNEQQYAFVFVVKVCETERETDKTRLKEQWEHFWRQFEARSQLCVYWLIM